LVAGVATFDAARGSAISNDRTIRRTLTVMAEAGWLEHELVLTASWHPGPKADERPTLCVTPPHVTIS